MARTTAGHLKFMKKEKDINNLNLLNNHGYLRKIILMTGNVQAHIIMVCCNNVKSVSEFKPCYIIAL